MTSRDIKKTSNEHKLAESSYIGNSTLTQNIDGYFPGIHYTIMTGFKNKMPKRK